MARGEMQIQKRVLEEIRKGNEKKRIQAQEDNECN
jgi:hypothetical protein